MKKYVALMLGSVVALAILSFGFTYVSGSAPGLIAVSSTILPDPPTVGP